MERMKVMVTIVNRGDGLALAKLYRQNGAPLHIQVAATGTASSELLSMLGLTHRERDLLPVSYTHLRADFLSCGGRRIISGHFPAPHAVFHQALPCA